MVIAKIIDSLMPTSKSTMYSNIMQNNNYFNSNNVEIVAPLSACSASEV